MSIETEINKRVGKELTETGMNEAITNLVGLLNSLIKIDNSLTEEEKERKLPPIKTKYKPFNLDNREHKMNEYIALFEHVENKESFGVVFPDIPGCISAGDNYEDAVRMAKEALSIHIEFIKESGEEIPKPRTLDEMKETWEDWDEWENNYKFITVKISI